MKDKLLRKIKSALLASLFLIVLLGIYSIYESESVDAFLFLIVIFFFSLAGNFLYGIPVSLFIDYLLRKRIKFYFLLSGFLHVFFGYITFFIIENLNSYAVICAALFFLSDEWQKSFKKPNYSRKRMLMNSCFVFGLSVFAVYSSFYVQELLEKKTNEYYLIPADYVGKVTVIYDIEDEPKPEKVGDHNVIKINHDGYGLTALPEPEGTFNNQYFYIDEDGHKEKIDEKCIHIGVSGSRSNNEREFSYHSFTVINSNCTSDFSMHGSQYLENHSIDVEEILQREGF
ncbi:hypothetical protein ABE65_019440 [Fictibacillus phosphorivorans]|uniref:DUF6843 domain-containing protein n=1 Tax=Fictibacillus phosphorivorans TaxID=1221500 RepID=A0A168WAH7_9BACL|nr:hypothetical protein [Fictibacillus phosphorivorans]ANC78855.1 hypothetical protein ABE65_019440 [Fictibacillus phosphorivorans]